MSDDLKINLGAFYRTRNNAVIGPVLAQPQSAKWPYFIEGVGSFDSAGRFNGPSYDDQKDLMQETDKPHDDLKAPERIWLPDATGDHASKVRTVATFPPTTGLPFIEYLRADKAAAELRAAQERIAELKASLDHTVELMNKLRIEALPRAHTRGWNDCAYAAEKIAKGHVNQHRKYTEVGSRTEKHDHQTGAIVASVIATAIAALRKEQPQTNRCPVTGKDCDQGCPTIRSLVHDSGWATTCHRHKEQP